MGEKVFSPQTSSRLHRYASLDSSPYTPLLSCFDLDYMVSLADFRRSAFEVIRTWASLFAIIVIYYALSVSYMAFVGKLDYKGNTYVSYSFIPSPQTADRPLKHLPRPEQSWPCLPSHTSRSCLPLFNSTSVQFQFVPPIPRQATQTSGLAWTNLGEYTELG